MEANDYFLLLPMKEMWSFSSYFMEVNIFPSIFYFLPTSSFCFRKSDVKYIDESKVLLPSTFDERDVIFSDYFKFIKINVFPFFSMFRCEHVILVHLEPVFVTKIWTNRTISLNKKSF